MNITMSDDPAVNLRIASALIAATKAAGNNIAISQMLREAKQVEVYLRTGSTNGR